MLSLRDRLEAAADRRGAITFLSGTAEPDRVSWHQLHDEARGAAARLQAHGVVPGAHVALLGPTTRPLVTAIQGIWMTGATLVVLPLPMRLGSIEEFVDATRIRIRAADVSLLVVDPDLAPFIEPEPGDPPMILLSDLMAGPGRPSPAAYERPTTSPDDLVILQFTSGSTSDPKGVMLPDRALGANLDGISEAVSLDPDHDVLVSWLPLYHDMGLVGLLTLSMTSGAELALAAPTDFLAAPARWMEWISAFGGTATAGPNFSWVLATRALRRSAQLDLSRMRVALNGAEPVDPDTVEAFIEAGARHGFRPGAVFPAFGMAEVAIAGTFPEPMSGLRTDAVDRRVLEQERLAVPADPSLPGTRRFAKLGKPVAGLEIRIVDPETGRVMNEREVGELQIRGTSVAAGYYKHPEATAASFDGEWLKTGDLAYMLDGEMVMCGRIKDVIVVGGRNVFPEDVERAVGGIDGVRPGNVIAFGVEGRGKESLVVVAETKESDAQLLRKHVAQRVVEAVGLPPKDVVLVLPGTLPKTSSGKLQRSLCKDRYLSDDLTVV